jgi:hypothetical protein
VGKGGTNTAYNRYAGAAFVHDSEAVKKLRWRWSEAFPLMQARSFSPPLRGEKIGMRGRPASPCVATEVEGFASLR